MSHFALLGWSVFILGFGAVLSAKTTRVSVTAPERGVAGRVAAFVGLVAIGAGIVGAGTALVLILRG